MVREVMEGTDAKDRHNTDTSVFLSVEVTAFGARRDVQPANRQDDDENDFLAAYELQTPYGRYRQRSDHEVRRCV
jgi:hypothetical protein